MQKALQKLKGLNQYWVMKWLFRCGFTPSCLAVSEILLPQGNASLRMSLQIFLFGNILEASQFSLSRSFLSPFLYVFLSFRTLHINTISFGIVPPEGQSGAVHTGSWQYLGKSWCIYPVNHLYQWRNTKKQNKTVHWNIIFHNKWVEIFQISLNRGLVKSFIVYLKNGVSQLCF